MEAGNDMKAWIIGSRIESDKHNWEKNMKKREKKRKKKKKIVSFFQKFQEVGNIFQK